MIAFSSCPVNSCDFWYTHDKDAGPTLTELYDCVECVQSWQ